MENRYPPRDAIITVSFCVSFQNPDIEARRKWPGYENGELSARRWENGRTSGEILATGIAAAVSYEVILIRHYSLAVITRRRCWPPRFRDVTISFRVRYYEFVTKNLLREQCYLRICSKCNYKSLCGRTHMNIGISFPYIIIQLLILYTNCVLINEHLHKLHFYIILCTRLCAFSNRIF